VHESDADGAEQYGTHGQKNEDWPESAFSVDATVGKVFVADAEKNTMYTTGLRIKDADQQYYGGRGERMQSAERLYCTIMAENARAVASRAGNF
jgi:hypothetical protein